MASNLGEVIDGARNGVEEGFDQVCACGAWLGVRVWASTERSQKVLNVLVLLLQKVEVTYCDQRQKDDNVVVGVISLVLGRVVNVVLDVGNQGDDAALDSDSARASFGSLGVN